MQMNVHLNFQGNCAEAFDFYKTVFGAQNTFTMKYGERPPRRTRAAGLEGQDHAYLDSARRWTADGLRCASGTLNTARRLSDLNAVQGRGRSKAHLRSAPSRRQRADANGAHLLVTHVRHVHRQIRRRMDDRNARSRQK